METEKLDLSFEEAIDLLSRTKIRKIMCGYRGNLVTAYQVGDNLIRMDILKD